MTNIAWMKSMDWCSDGRQHTWYRVYSIILYCIVLYIQSLCSTIIRVGECQCTIQTVPNPLDVGRKATERPNVVLNVSIPYHTIPYHTSTQIEDLNIAVSMTDAEPGKEDSSSMTASYGFKGQWANNADLGGVSECVSVCNIWFGSLVVDYAGHYQLNTKQITWLNYHTIPYHTIPYHTWLRSFSGYDAINARGVKLHK